MSTESYSPFADALNRTWGGWLPRYVGRNDHPDEFRAPLPSLFEKFDRDPTEALYALFLWQQEAESRAYELDPVLEPFYFSDLTRMLAVYAHRLGLDVRSMWIFWQCTTIESRGPAPEQRRPAHAEAESVYRDTEYEQHRFFFAVFLKVGELPFASESLPAMSHCILEALRECGRLTGEPLARRAGYPYDSRFKQECSTLRRLRLIDSSRRDGYTLTSQGAEILRRQKSLTKS